MSVEEKNLFKPLEQETLYLNTFCFSSRIYYELLYVSTFRTNVYTDD